MGQKHAIIKNCTEVDERFRDHNGTPRSLSKKGTRNSFIKIVIDEREWRAAANYYHSLKKANQDLQVTLSHPADDVISESKITVVKPQSLNKSEVQVRARQIRDAAKKTRRYKVSLRLKEIREGIKVKDKKMTAPPIEKEQGGVDELNTIQRESKTGNADTDLGIKEGGKYTMKQLNALEEMQIFEIAQSKEIEITSDKDIEQIKKEIVEKSG
jgi:hypothetical protein